MNKDRRKRISELISQLEGIKVEIDDLEGEEQEAYDNLPESLQSGEKGEAMNSAIENLNSASSEVDSAMDSLNSSIE